MFWALGNWIWSNWCLVWFICSCCRVWCTRWVSRNCIQCWVCFHWRIWSVGFIMMGSCQCRLGYLFIPFWSFGFGLLFWFEIEERNIHKHRQLNQLSVDLSGQSSSTSRKYCFASSGNYLKVVCSDIKSWLFGNSNRLNLWFSMSGIFYHTYCISMDLIWLSLSALRNVVLRQSFALSLSLWPSLNMNIHLVSLSIDTNRLLLEMFRLRNIV